MLYMQRYASPSVIGQKVLGPAQYKELVAKLDHLILVEFLSKLNTALQTDGQHNPDFQRYVASLFFTSVELAQLESYFRKNGDSFVWITPLHIRVLLIQCLNSDSSGELDHIEGKAIVGKLLLSSVDTFAPTSRKYDVRDPLSKVDLGMDAEKRAYLGSTESGTIFELKELLTSELMKNEGFEKHFLERYGFSVVDVYTGLISIWIRCRQLTPKYLGHSNGSSVNVAMLFGTFGLKSKLFDFINDQFCIAVENPKGAVNRDLSIASLVDRPLAFFPPHNVWCLDLDYLFVRVTRAIFNLAIKVETNIHGVAGTLFQNYCENLVERLVELNGERYRLYSRSKLKTAALDDLVIYGDVAIALEYKSGLIPLKLIHSGTPEEVAQYLREAYIYGREGKNLGFSQIKDHALTLLEKATGYELQFIRKIRPVLIVEDRSMSLGFFNDFVRNEAKKMFKYRNTPFLDPVILHVDDLKYFIAVNDAIRLDAALSWLARENLIGHGTAQNYLYQRFVKNSNAKEAEVITSETSPLFERVIEKIASDYDEPVMLKCKVCNDDMQLFEDQNSTMKWWCNTCDRQSDQPVPNEILTAHVEHVRVAIEKFYSDRN